METVGLTTVSGHEVTAVISFPVRTRAPAVIAIHGLFGSSDWHKSRAQVLAAEGFVGLAVDLYGGRIATDPDTGARFMNEVNADPQKAKEVLISWADWLKADGRSNGKIGFLGWSFGAWWALTAALNTPADATVLYYGLTYGGDSLTTEREISELRKLNGPVLGIFAVGDVSIDPRRVEKFANEMKAAGKRFDTRWYPAAQSFADPDPPGYDMISAGQAWFDAMAFFRSNLT
jgi:carboxymethylenebutenolidase